MVNISARLYTRSGSVVHTFRLSDFFPGALGPYPFDPKLMYDSLSQRWFASAVSFADNPPGQQDQGRLHIGLSTTSSPLNWWTFSIQYDDVFPDYPGLGLTSDKVTLSSNLFDIDNSPSSCPFGRYCGEQTIVLEKAHLLAGLLPSLFEFPRRTDRQTTRPVQSLTTVNDQHLVTRRKLTPDIDPDFCHASFANTLTVIRITGTPAAGNVAEASVVDRTILPQTRPPTNMLQKGLDGSPRPFTVQQDCRMLDAAWRAGRLWTSATTSCNHTGDPTTRACAHVVEVSTGTNTVSQDIVFGATGAYYIFPAVRTDRSGNLYVSFSRSSGTIFPEARAAGRRFSDDPSTMTGSALVRAGDWPYCSDGDCQRWGDYLGVAVDPNFPNCVWLVSEYAKNTGVIHLNWGSYIAATSYSSSAGGTDTDCDGWSDAAEVIIGTDPLDDCPDNAADNAWPADINNDTISDITDLIAVGGSFGKTVPPAPARHDVAPDPPDRVVDISDITKMSAFFGKSCT